MQHSSTFSQAWVDILQEYNNTIKGKIKIEKLRYNCAEYIFNYIVVSSNFDKTTVLCHLGIKKGSSILQVCKFKSF